MDRLTLWSQIINARDKDTMLDKSKEYIKEYCQGNLREKYYTKELLNRVLKGDINSLVIFVGLLVSE